jgi:hypothetical protein
MDKATRWTSRKFWAAMVWQAVFCVLLWAGKLPPEIFFNLALITIGGYLASNVVQQFAQRGSAQQPPGTPY